MNTTIRDVRFYRAVSSVSKPVADSTHTISKIAFYVAQVETADGVRGQGYLLAFHYSPNAIEGALRDCGAFLRAREYQVYETRRVRQEWDMEAEYFGRSGINACAMAAVNTAMWDAWGRTLGQPVWKLLGGSARKIPVYGSGGWISYTDKELLEEVLDYKSRGFAAVKIKVGHPDGVERDLARLRLCREKLGGGVRIMMDANQGMDLPDALALAEKAREIGIAWFEEPVSNTDFTGYQQLRQKCGMSLAMGEREYDCEALKSLIARNALDLWQPDLIRLGGVEGWRGSALLADHYHIPVLPHYYKDYDVPLLCTVPRAYGAESFDWIDGIIDNTMHIENGFAYPRQAPGWGFSFKESCLEEML